MASDLGTLSSGPASGLREPCSTGFVWSSSRGLGTGCSGVGESERRVRWKTTPVFPPPAQQLACSSVPWKNDDLTSLKPCHLSPTDSLKRVPCLSRMGFQSPLFLKVSERKIFLLLLSKCWLWKWRGSWKFPPSLGSSGVHITATVGLRRSSPRECLAVRPLLCPRQSVEGPWAWSLS